jgi:hypothetical protein
MKSEELRIGNRLYSDGVVVTIDGRSIFDVWTDEHLKIHTKYKPIPLTTEWLEKFGFYRIWHLNHFEFVNNQKDRNFDIEFVFRPEGNDGPFMVQMAVQPEPDYYQPSTVNYIYLPHIKYVHQLQNLYYALTGEELTIKDKE